MNQAWHCSICMNSSDSLRKKWEIGSRAFYKVWKTVLFFFLSLVFPFHASSDGVSAEWGIFHMDRYSISVTVFYLLMCCRLKVGREDEPAHWYYRLLRKGIRREGGKGDEWWLTCLPRRGKDQSPSAGSLLLKIEKMHHIYKMGILFVNKQSGQSIDW